MQSTLVSTSPKLQGARLSAGRCDPAVRVYKSLWRGNLADSCRLLEKTALFNSRRSFRQEHIDLPPEILFPAGPTEFSSHLSQRRCDRYIRLRGVRVPRFISSMRTAVRFKPGVAVKGVEFPNEVLSSRRLRKTGASCALTMCEGWYAVTGTSEGLSGRASVFVPNNGVASLNVALQASGSVTGQVLMPDGLTPASLADVFLVVAGRTVGHTVTSDDGAGAFRFTQVPVGDFKLQVFDNRTGRKGRWEVPAAKDATKSGGQSGADRQIGKGETERRPVTKRCTPQAGEAGWTSLRKGYHNADEHRFSGIPTGKFGCATYGARGVTGSAERCLGSRRAVARQPVDFRSRTERDPRGRVLDSTGTRWPARK